MEESKNPEELPCHTCPLRARAQANPDGFVSRLWRWHTSWCPGWKAYQAALESVSAE